MNHEFKSNKSKHRFTRDDFMGKSMYLISFRRRPPLFLVIFSEKINNDFNEIIAFPSFRNNLPEKEKKNV